MCDDFVVGAAHGSTNYSKNRSWQHGCIQAASQHEHSNLRAFCIACMHHSAGKALKLRRGENECAKQREGKTEGQVKKRHDDDDES